MIADRRNLSRGFSGGKYGHLRPGTPDILSSRYDETPELLLREAAQLRNKTGFPFSLTLEQCRAIQDAMTQHGLGDLLALFSLSARGLKGRNTPNVFTKRPFHFSVIELAARLGAGTAIRARTCPISSISVIVYGSHEDIRRTLGESIRAGARKSMPCSGNPHCRRSSACPQDVMTFSCRQDSPITLLSKSVGGQVCGDALRANRSREKFC